MTTIHFITRTRKDRTWVAHGLRKVEGVQGDSYAFVRGGRDYFIDHHGALLVLTKRGFWTRIGTSTTVEDGS